MFRVSLLFLGMLGCWMMDGIHAQEIDVWLGTSGSTRSKGIYHCRLNSATGQLSESELVAEIRGPGFLAMHPKRSHLYAVGTLDDTPSVVAYKITGLGSTASLSLVNALPIGDGGASHVSVDPTGTTLLTAQYGGGSTAAFALADDGSLLKQTALIKHQGGSGVVENRQDAPHAHWTGFSPDNRFVFVPDLGLDQVVIYEHDLENATIRPHGQASLPPGGGPRHMKFHPNGKWIYVLNELALSVSVFDYDSQQGAMSIKQTIPTISEEEKNAEQFTSCSEIRIHPNGKFVYAANRGHDTITVFSLDEQGLLTPIQVENIRGATPRNFNLDPSAKWLLAGGQDSHTLSVFEVHPDTGRITYNRSVITTPSPICVLFGPE